MLLQGRCPPPRHYTAPRILSRQGKTPRRFTTLPSVAKRHHWPDLSGWGQSTHNAINQATAGSAWNWATALSSGEFVSGCAAFGAGTLVITGRDPESHTGNPGVLPMIENEIAAGTSGLCAVAPPTPTATATPDPTATPRHRRRFGGGVANLPLLAQTARDNRDRAAAAAAPVIAPPSTGTGVTIRPPSTGDAGLVRSQSGLVSGGMLLVLPAGTVGLGLSAARVVNRRR